MFCRLLWSTLLFAIAAMTSMGVVCGHVPRIASATGASPLQRGSFQRALTVAEIARLNEFFSQHDAILVENDSTALLERYDLDARDSALAWMEQVEGRISGARSKIALGWRIRDRVCAVVRTAYDIAPTRQSKGLRQERIDQRIILLREEGQTFRIAQLSPVRISVGAHEIEDFRAISCHACNFRVEAQPDWFVIHHHAVGGSLTEKLSLHHVSGQATMEIEILELPETADPKESLELDHELSIALAGLPPHRVKTIDASTIPPMLGGLPGYRMQVTLPRADGGEDYIARCYRARTEVLYTMTAYGDAAAWDREPQILEDVEAMFDSFAVLDEKLMGDDQRRRMLDHHQPGFSSEGHRFRDSVTGLSISGPEGWSMRPLACGRVRWAPHEHPPKGHHARQEQAWVELTWMSSQNGWSDRAPALMRQWEKNFDSFPEVRRGSVRMIDSAHKRPVNQVDQMLITELFTADYSYQTPKGAKRRTRMAYIPCGKLIFLVRADATEEEFLRLERDFDAALESFTIG